MAKLRLIAKQANEQAAANGQAQANGQTQANS